MVTNTIDQAHSVPYAVGYMFDQIQPRLAMVTHTSFDEELVPEIVAGIRHHYRGLFQFGAPDVVVVNVDKDSVWTRKAVIPDASNMSRPKPREAAELFDLTPTNLKVTFPTPRHGIADNLDQAVFDREIDPKKYYPTDLYREPQPNFPADFTIDVREIAEVEASPHPGEARGQTGSVAARRRRHRTGGGLVVLELTLALARPENDQLEVAAGRSGTEAIPLTVLTGFLGAGKTTLLNRILTGDHGLRLAVLVNDFGSINIDADLIVGVESEGDVISLANGCVCCNVRDDLVTAVTQLMTRPEQPEYILLEASGVAEPSGIAFTFMDESLRDRIRLDSIMCVVDAEQVFAVPELMELKLRQIAFADMLILNKVDLVTREQVEQIKAWLDDRFHRYRLVEACGGDVPLEILLSVGRFDPSRLDGGRSSDQAEQSRCLCRSRFRPAPSRWSTRSPTGLQDVELRNGPAALHGSAARVREEIARQRVPMQGHRPYHRGTGPKGHPPGCRQASGHCRRARVEGPSPTDPDRRHRYGRCNG